MGELVGIDAGKHFTTRSKTLKNCEKLEENRQETCTTIAQVSRGTKKSYARRNLYGTADMFYCNSCLTP